MVLVIALVAVPSATVVLMVVTAPLTYQALIASFLSFVGDLFDFAVISVGRSFQSC